MCPTWRCPHLGLLPRWHIGHLGPPGSLGLCLVATALAVSPRSGPVSTQSRAGSQNVLDSRLPALLGCVQGWPTTLRQWIFAQTFMITLSTTATGGESPRAPSAHMDAPWSVHMTGRGSATRGNEAMTGATAWTHPGDVASQNNTQRAIRSVIPFLRNPQKRQIRGQDADRRWPGAGRGDGVSFWGEEKVPELDGDGGGAAL